MEIKITNMVAVVQGLSICVCVLLQVREEPCSTCLCDAVDSLTNTIVLQTSLFKNVMAISQQSETEEKMPSAAILFI